MNPVIAGIHLPGMVQEPPGTMTIPGIANPPHTLGGRLQMAELSIVVCVALIAAGAMLLTENQRRHQHQHVAQRPRATAASASHHPHRWRRYGLIVAAAVLLVLVVLLYPFIARGF
jgi:Ca2+/H+ antiporter